MPYSDPEQQREYVRLWIAKRRSDWLAANGPCAHCGSWDKLEIDHIDATTKVDHKVWSWAKERRLQELAKCQVLCYDCHLIKGRACGDILPAATHGKYWYEQKGCRCDVCRASHTKYQVAWRRRKRGRSSIGGASGLHPEG